MTQLETLSPMDSKSWESADEYKPQLPYHTLSEESTAKRFGVSIYEGLTDDEAARRLALVGLNELKGQHSVKWYKILLAQIMNAMTAVLILAMILSIVSGDMVETGVLIFVIATNTTIGFVQEFQAEQTVEALRRMASPTARVIRNCGNAMHISANEVVPGDVLCFEEGDVIPADSRLVESFHLQLDEALLTGESLPVNKKLDVIPREDEPIGDRINLVYSSTTVTRGRGKAIAIRTGMDTEVGKIAREITRSEQAGNEKTPVQKTMDMMAYALLGVVCVLAIIVFSVNKWDMSHETIGYAISVGIAVIPEGLVAVITITMAFGVKGMAKQRCLVRRLVALEGLGSVTNICSDKTGTLTQGKMVVRKLYIPSLGYFAVTGDGYRPVGSIVSIKSEKDAIVDDNSTRLDISKLPITMLRFIECAALCNMSVVKRRGLTPEDQQEQLIHPEKEKSLKANEKLSVNELLLTAVEDWEAFGDPTEAALQVLSWKAHLCKPLLASQPTPAAPLSFKLAQEFSFDSTLKRMSVIYEDTTKGVYHVFSKGAVESVLNLCVGRLDDHGEVTVLDEAENLKFHRDVNHRMEGMAEFGLRVLALAFRRLDGMNLDQVMSLERNATEKNLIFLGLAGIYDPPRPESAPAVEQCKQAGIVIHMATGDHPKTAFAIAREIGIAEKTTDKKLLLTASEFDGIPDDEIVASQRFPLVIARCSPTTKVKLVNTLQRCGRIVAMTGDGTNDAPSLKKANIGIAMGMAGSDVAKQASDIVLTAVAEGRRIFANIQKFVVHLMSGNISEIIALIIGLAYIDQDGTSVYPMSPVQILFLNMVTSSIPAMALGIEKARPDIMKKPPRASKSAVAAVFTQEVVMDLSYYGTVMGILTLGAWSVVLYTSNQDNPLGRLCNSMPKEADGPSYYPGCETVYRARATSFLFLTYALLLHAYNCRSFRYSIFFSKKYGGWHNVVSNKLLFFSVIIGAIVSASTVYIPGLNTSGFRQLPITWEWGVVFGFNIVFMLLSEFYKYLRRCLYYPKQDAIDLAVITTGI